MKWTKGMEEFDDMFASVKASVEMECGPMSPEGEQLIKDYFFTDMSREEFIRKALKLAGVKDVEYHLNCWKKAKGTSHPFDEE
ncbi:hypothetical protein [Anoxybacillus kestanbolensis]|uniref:hypothetical protein n=1 Tax=Anoxybacillus kestanbolensis TaxID=227476 RepID=UPI003D22142A